MAAHPMDHYKVEIARLEFEATWPSEYFQWCPVRLGYQPAPAFEDLIGFRKCLERDNLLKVWLSAKGLPHEF